ncbi:PEGA domain-containing protein [Candidatus Poribacteria bacterium]|nr:PEGA domain-containing protein [Candidatus Poribacteria bacterium]
MRCFHLWCWTNNPKDAVYCFHCGRNIAQSRRLITSIIVVIIVMLMAVIIYSRRISPSKDNPPEISKVSVASDDTVVANNEIDETETTIVTFYASDPDGAPVTPSATWLNTGKSVTVTHITDNKGNVIATVKWLTGFGDAGAYKLQLKAMSTGASGIELSDTEIIDFTVNKFNRLPKVSNVAISPNTPKDADNLTVNYTFSDENKDGENGTKIQWYKNGAEQTGLRNSHTVSSRLTTPGEKWTVMVNPSDNGGKTFGYKEGSEPSATVTIIYTTPDRNKPKPPVSPLDTRDIKPTIEKPTVTTAQPTIEYGNVVITSQPIGAEVYIDGKYKGRSACTIKLPVGAHAISLKMSGYLPWDAAVYVSSDKTVKVTPELFKEP